MSALLPVLADNQRPDLCGPCGGRCCKTMPGIAYPEDFGSTDEERIQRLADALRTGKWTVDYTFEDGLVRPAIKGSEGEMWDFAMKHGGECALLTEAGCELPFAERPTQCRVLVPVGRGCQMPTEYHYPAMHVWDAHQGVIHAAEELAESAQAPGPRPQAPGPRPQAPGPRP